MKRVGSREFKNRWFELSVLEVGAITMAALPMLVERFKIRGADAVHLSAARWLRDMVRLVPEFAAGDKRLELATADEDVGDFARESGLIVSRP